MTEWINAVHTGDAAETLRELPESSVHMCMTSPPYFGLRDYGVDGQIGLEDSLDEYVAELVDVCDAIRHALRPDGSLWLNLGDSYGGDSIVRGDGEWTRPGDDGYEEAHTSEYGDGRRSMSSLGRKNKMLVPHRVAIALQRDGWVVRNDVTWHKPNPMPSSVKDRLNTTTEQIFHLVPNADYWYDLDAIREPHATAEHHERYHSDGIDRPKLEQTEDADGVEGTGLHPSGKNPGDVFEVTTKPFPDAHFAVYPPELCEKPIKATAPPKVCPACGSPYERQKEVVKSWRDDGVSYEESNEEHPQKAREGTPNGRERLARDNSDGGGGFSENTYQFNGWTAKCDCDTDATEPGIVCDPFAGAGTTLMKAKELGRQFVGVELNPEYADMARKRCGLELNDPSHDREPEELGLETFATDGGDHES